jgi:DNA modification methylase
MLKSLSLPAPTSRLAVDYIPIDDLTLDPDNARAHTRAQIRQIAKSIQSFGYNAPILVDRAGKVIAGHGRLLACRDLGWTEVPIIRLEHLTPLQARAYAIADNRLTETSKWDEALLGQSLNILAQADLDFDMEAIGFSMGEIDLKIEGLDGLVEQDADDTAPPSGPAVSRPGDLWTLGAHRLLCASALEQTSYERLLGGARAAMVFTDPPYNVKVLGHVSGKGAKHHREFVMASGEMSEAEFSVFLTRTCTLMANASAPGSLHYVFMDWRHVFPLIAAGRSAYEDLINMCVWSKSNGGMGGLYRSAHELICVFKLGGGAHRNNVQLGRFGRNRTNVWAYPGISGFGTRSSEEADLLAQHPTPKPVRLVADAILDASARGDLVLDPFCGSGSTLIACERVGRAARLIELDPLYVDLAIRRWMRLTGEEAQLETGETFTQRAKDQAEVLA